MLAALQLNINCAKLYLSITAAHVPSTLPNCFLTQCIKKDKILETLLENAPHPLHRICVGTINGRIGLPVGMVDSGMGVAWSQTFVGCQAVGPDGDAAVDGT